ncbi:DUF916 and DUF3324 domain-containing protein [Marinilactibacillus sp. GCM10026970]|uniref:DUF916 and DUF3324 domain-containing protein n=1 Tax=Marinilactibacillus sp. GCM10026970 TaxID=3252642 RepID=UPI0036097E04
MIRSKRNKLIGWLLLLGIVLLAGNPEAASASEISETVKFSVRAVIPENQRDLDQTYFDLSIEPDQEQVIETEIMNNSNEDITVMVNLNNAATNRNGVIVYDVVDAIVYSDHPLNTIAELDTSEIQLEAGETKSVFVDITAPSEPFDGIILGGLRFQEKREDIQEVESDVSIRNDYAYVIGVQLSQNENELEPNLELVDVEPGLSNSRTAVIAQIQNMEPMIMRNMNISASIYENETLIRNAELEDARIAPDSVLDFVIDWENFRIEAGDYSVTLTASNELGEWTFDESFTITEEEEEEVNEQAVVAVENNSNQNPTNQNPSNMLFLYIIIVVLFVVMSIMLTYIVKTKIKLKREPH